MASFDRKPAMRPFFSAVLLVVAAASSTGVRAQDGSIPTLTRQAVTACENFVTSGGILASQTVLQGFVPVQVASAEEALGRGFSYAQGTAYVRLMRKEDVCVVMVTDTIRHTAGPSVEAWAKGANVTFESRSDGARWGRRGQLEYRYSVAQGGTHVLLVKRRP